MGTVVLLIGFALAVGVVFFARRRDRYSHLAQTISELGERGSSDGMVVSLGLFLPVGVALAVIAYLQRSTSSTSAALAGAIAVGYCGAALFRCDPGSPLQGSWGQAIHNLAGGVQYVGGTLALWDLGARSGPMFKPLAVVVAMATIFLSLPVLFAWRGLAQRLGELALFVGLAWALWPQHAP